MFFRICYSDRLLPSHQGFAPAMTPWYDSAGLSSTRSSLPSTRHLGQGLKPHEPSPSPRAYVTPAFFRGRARLLVLLRRWSFAPSRYLTSFVMTYFTNFKASPRGSRVARCP